MKKAVISVLETARRPERSNFGIGAKRSEERLPRLDSSSPCGEADYARGRQKKVDSLVGSVDAPGPEKHMEGRKFLADDKLSSSSECTTGENRQQSTTGHPRRKVSESHEHYRYTAGAELGSYNGSSCLETFLARFDNCTRYFRWDAENKLFQ